MLLDVITDFIQELRAAGIPVSMVEAIDAMEAIRRIDLADRSALKVALGATLVKNIRHYAAFDTAFEVYFALDPRQEDEPVDRDSGDSLAGAAPGAGGGGLMDSLVAALGSDDDALLRALARYAVRRFAGMESGRPVGGTYYLYRALRPFDFDEAVEQLVEGVSGAPMTAIEERLLRESLRSRVAAFREQVQSEVRRRLVADRGREAVAETLRATPLEDMDLMHATRAELVEIERAIHPLTRKLAARLAERRRRGRVGRLDFRRTVRNSLSTGGVPVEPRFRAKRPSRPDVMLLSDISGSMATFARFTLQFVFAMAAEFSRLRSFAFIDGLDEVTGFFAPGVDFEAAVSRLHEEAEVLWFDGHSDYGHSLEMFWERYGGEINPKATVIIAGDARTNYRDPRPDLLARIAEAARSVYWLNPEPGAYWNTGDSVMRVYDPFSDQFEVRTLRQLSAFVEQVTA